jgi:sulfite reductase alpha subunit-like flavoprotein
MRRNLTGDLLKSIQFTVLGLGDSSYPKFNFVAKKLHRRLLQLGAVEIHERGLADDQSENGVDDCLIPWLDGLWIKVIQKYPVPSHLNIIPANALYVN